MDATPSHYISALGLEGGMERYRSTGVSGLVALMAADRAMLRRDGRETARARLQRRETIGFEGEEGCTPASSSAQDRLAEWWVWEDSGALFHRAPHRRRSLVP